LIGGLAAVERIGWTGWSAKASQPELRQSGTLRYNDGFRLVGTWRKT
jgi:hypothetical protein